MTTRAGTIFFFLIILAISVIGFTLPSFLISSEPMPQGPRVLFTYHEDMILNMEELIQESDLIVIADVGPVLAREYPLAYRQQEFSEEEWALMNEGNKYVNQHRIAFHQLVVEETLKGQALEVIPLLRTDVEYFKHIDLSAISEGQKLLFFIERKEGDFSFAKSFDIFYTAFDDNGIFDLEGNRVYPRFPLAFENQTGSFYNNKTDPIRPFFELGKLREAINLAK